MTAPLLARRTRVEVVESPPDLLVVPIGALEQHGPHLAIGTDSIHAEAVALRGAEAAAGIDVAVAPVLAYGCSDHHIPFGATLSLSSATLLAVLRDLVRSAAASGFRRVFFLNGHGGNHEIIQVAARDGAQEFGIPVGAGSWWAMARDQLVESGGEDGTRLPGHAGGFETAMIAAILGEPIRDLPGPSSAFGPTDPRRTEATFRTERPEGWSDTDGYTDDPAALDIDAGRRLLDVAGRVVGADFVRFVAHTPIPTQEH